MHVIVIFGDGDLDGCSGLNGDEREGGGHDIEESEE